VNTKIFEKAEKMVALLKEKNLKIATAESCTGGMVASYITSVSGVSQVFELGVTSYSNDIKNRILNVNAQTLETVGAVSADTAKQMAENVRDLAKSDIGVSVTGVAGPAAQEGHPVGLVYVGFADQNGSFAKVLNIEPQSRNFVREQTVLAVFDTVINYIKS
jgi:PncC family amidohydrolase